MHKLVFGENFWSRYQVLVRRDSKLKKKIVKVLKLLALDPRQASLKSHKVATRKFGERWASRVSGDLRIIWDYDENNRLTILVLALGGHSGKQRVYS